mmetsp:Transcript_2293/g.4186  ORF Transcript_2293/g.4186 Transcript_2293/m.4186 type:complete len:110 (+) Transcript_2293:258-587(+)
MFKQWVAQLIEQLLLSRELCSAAAAVSEGYLVWRCFWRLAGCCSGLSLCRNGLNEVAMCSRLLAPSIKSSTGCRVLFVFFDDFGKVFLFQGSHKTSQRRSHLIWGWQLR